MKLNFIVRLFCWTHFVLLEHIFPYFVETTQCNISLHWADWLWNDNRIFFYSIDFNLFINTASINILEVHIVLGKVMGQYSAGCGNCPRELNNLFAWCVCFAQGFYKQKIFLVVNNHISSLPFQTSLLCRLGRAACSGPRPRLLHYNATWPSQGKCFLRLITPLHFSAPFSPSEVLHCSRMAISLPAS